MRRTASFWPFQAATDPVAAKFTAIPKFVVSRTLTDPSWADTTVLRDRTGRRVAARQVRRGTYLGQRRAAAGTSCGRPREPHDLWLYPIALGTGKRLFETGIVPTTFRPAQATQVFDAGVMALVLEPAGDVETVEVADTRAWCSPRCRP